jgi:CO/xanthine dehydrogenase Mo-binding subunit
MRRRKRTARSPRPEHNDRFIVHSCAQGLFFSLGTTAKILNLESNRLHFRRRHGRGGFGGKVDTLTEPLAVLGAMLTGRPVRYVLDREEEMLYGSPRGAERIYIKDGVRRDGRIIARHIRSYFDAGAYTRLSSYAGIKCTAHIRGRTRSRTSPPTSTSSTRTAARRQRCAASA